MSFILRRLLGGRRAVYPAGAPRLPYSSVAPEIRERTLIAVKPDGVQRRLVGEIVKRFEQRGFKLVGIKMLQASEGILMKHYHDLQRKPFYPALIRYMASGPVVAMVWEGHNVVRSSRLMVGETDSSQAKPGTVRGDFTVHISRNIIHASDSVEVAEKEIGLWFHGAELIDWETNDHSDLYQTPQTSTEPAEEPIKHLEGSSV